MFGFGRIARPIVVVIVVLTFTSHSMAGWVTFRNDSPRGIVVQEVVRAPDGSVTRGRPTRLLPGETLREFRAGPMSKWIEVYDMQAQTKPIYTGKLTWITENQTFSITSTGKSAAVTPLGREVISRTNK